MLNYKLEATMNKSNTYGCDNKTAFMPLQEGNSIMISIMYKKQTRKQMLYQVYEVMDTMEINKNVQKSLHGCELTVLRLNQVNIQMSFFKENTKEMLFTTHQAFLNRSNLSGHRKTLLLIGRSLRAQEALVQIYLQ